MRSRDAAAAIRARADLWNRYNGGMTGGGRIEVFLGDIVQMRKKHPCGSFEWEVVRLGADIGMVCQTCQRRVLLPRGTFNKRLKRIVRRAGGPALQ